MLSAVDHLRDLYSSQSCHIDLWKTHIFLMWQHSLRSSTATYLLFTYI